jgi:hypothetical protein
LQVSGGGELLVWTAGHHHDEPKEN